VGAENVEAVADRLLALGATFLHQGQQGPHTWVTLADPEGNEFCVVGGARCATTAFRPFAGGAMLATMRGWACRYQRVKWL
jgi:Glyoxalase-like domain